MNTVIEKSNIEDMIYEIRGVQVMLDSDLARLFDVETKRINEAVKNNPKKFPDRYSWRLTNDESKKFLVEYFDQKNIETRGGRYKNPRVFTEHGIVMLSTILKSNIAIEMSIRITDAFVKMRHFIIENKDVYKSLNNINNTLIEHNEKIEYLFSKFDKRGEILLKDKTYSAYKTILDILNLATSEIIVIDSYADITFLDLIRNIKCDVVLITRDSERLTDIEIEKYNKEYHNLKVKRNNDFHDRCIIIDNNEIYLLGSSINNLGNKISIIIKAEDFMIKNDLKEIINKIIK